MNTLRSLWASIMGNPVMMQRIHFFATIAWIAAIPVSLFLRESIMWVVFMSHYAIITGHWSSWQAARVEVKQEEQAPSIPPMLKLMLPKGYRLEFYKP